MNSETRASDDASSAAAALAEEYLASLRRGESPNIADFVARRPDLAPRLEDALSALRVLEAPRVGGIAPAARSLGAYDLVREIGRGGMGVVYEAVHRDLKRRAAVKVMTSSVHATPRAVERFRREAAVAARLAHPALCVVYEAGVADGAPFIAMQYVEGETLARRIARRKNAEASVDSTLIESGRPVDATPSTPTATAPPPTLPAAFPKPASPEETRAIARLVAEAADALHVAHEAGVVHRDVKPGNLMITPDGRPVWLDFGLALDVTSEDPELTATGDVVGTPAYLAPEQVRGAPADRRTDVWALGVSLYEAIAGRRPFAAPTRAGLFAAIVDEEPTGLDRVAPRTSRDLAFVVATALSKDPARRYATAADFADDVRRAVAGAPIAARPVPAIVRAYALVKRRPAAAGLLAATLLLIVGSAGFAGFYTATRADAATARRVEALARVEEALGEGYARLGVGPTFAQGAAAAFERAGAELAKYGDALEPAARAALGDECLGAAATAAFEAGRPTDAIAILDRDPTLSTRSPAALVIRENALRALGREAEAKALGVPPSPPRTFFERFLRGLINAGRASTGDASRAKAAFDDLSDAIAAAPRPRQGLHLLHVRAAGLSRDAELLARAEAPLHQRWPDRWSTWFATGLARQDSGAPAAAAEAFDRAIRFDPPPDARPEIFARLADARRQIGDFPAALAAAEEALRLAPRAPTAILARALIRHSSGDREGAEADYETALEIDGDLQIARRHLAMLARQSGDAEKARALVDAAVKSDPNDAKARYLDGAIHFEAGSFDEAVAAFREAVRLAPKDAAFGLALARALSEQAKGAEALDAARAALKLAPDDAEVARMVASLAVDLGLPAEAVAALKPVVDAGAPSGETLGLYGKALLDAGRFDDAIEALVRARKEKLAPELDAEAARWIAEAEAGRGSEGGPASREAP